jgi:acyl-CoA synthetase (AMP-forming)/AMP-acid ligase II
VPVAFVVGRGGADDVTAAVRDRLGSYQKPHAVYFRDVLPVSSAGKIALSQLKDEADRLRADAGAASAPLGSTTEA